jgi:hypothetical protein
MHSAKRRSTADSVSFLMPIANSIVHFTTDDNTRVIRVRALVKMTKLERYIKRIGFSRAIFFFFFFAKKNLLTRNTQTEP